MKNFDKSVRNKTKTPNRSGQKTWIVTSKRYDNGIAD